ncbi:MT-A70-domain-containing protein [Pelagophyceae sp. CCMP2097]|nr:MT-A70-domain-containing protein [Pelagophyceae sp. CCMP2097]
MAESPESPESPESHILFRQGCCALLASSDEAIAKWQRPYGHKAPPAAEPAAEAAPDVDVDVAGTKRHRRKQPRGADIENVAGLHDFISEVLLRLSAQSADLIARNAFPVSKARPVDGSGRIGRALTEAVSAARGDVSEKRVDCNCRLELVDMASSVLVNASKNTSNISVPGGSFELAPQSTAFVADVARWGAAPSLKEKYDVVLADPPWPSRSAARRKLYKAGDGQPDDGAWRESLLAFDVPGRVDAGKGAIVAVWVTNDQKIEAWVRNVLFPTWNVEYVTTWYWIKVTAKGEPVLPLSKSAPRKSWEPLIVGVICGEDGGGDDDDLAALAKSLEAVAWRRCSKSDGDGGFKGLSTVPRAVGFASVPEAAHSAKPRLDALLDPCFTGDTPLKQLELFGRRTHSHWTTLGDQALGFVAEEAPPNVDPS